MRSKLVVGVSGVVLCSACGLFPDLSPLTRDGGTSLDATAGDAESGAPDAQPDAPVSTCPSAPCAAGHCQAVVLVSDATSDARGMAQTSNLLLWATGCTGVVRKVGKDGAGNTPLPAGANCTPTVAVSGPNVYWIEYDGPYLYTTPIDGSQPASIVAEVTQTGARSDFARLAVDGQNAYWATTTPPPAIWYAPLASNHITALPIAGASVQQQVSAPYGVAVDSTYVYWADEGANFIKRRAIASLGQDALGQLVINETGPHDITLDATNVYFVTTDGFVRAIAKDGTGTPKTLASGQAKAESIIVDDVYVYWTIYAANATVNRVPKIGGNVEVLATGQNYPYSLTQDCDTIYWTNQANFATGQVMKLTK